MLRPWPSLILAFFLAIAVTLPLKAGIHSPSKGNGLIAAECLKIIKRVAYRTRVPERLLLSIALAESGLPCGAKRVPWPWALNVKGKSYHFKTKEAACAYLMTLHRQGVRNIDIGIMQVNLRWHGRHFKSINDLLDPHQNILYAALHLKALFQEVGNWTDTIKAYHSRDPDLSEPYLRRVIMASSSF